MIKSLEIRNFKSVKRLELNCGRINIFIGEPNTGKSNILETLGLLSFGAYGIYASHSIRNFVRMELMGNLFYDENLDEKIEIRADDKLLDIEFRNGRFEGEFSVNGEKGLSFHCDYSGHCTIPAGGLLIFF
ncbi:MAG: AAA family ATPase [Candidatus Freyarchaeota archaeon]